MGEVYRARDTRLDRIVAIKVVASALVDAPELRERFDREARAVAALNHPHICTLHDIGHEQGIDFLVMEHLEGETLADRLSKGALPIAVTNSGFPYAVTADGKRFLVAQQPEQQAATVTVVLNWTAALPRQ